MPKIKAKESFYQYSFKSSSYVLRLSWGTYCMSWDVTWISFYRSDAWNHRTHSWNVSQHVSFVLWTGFSISILFIYDQLLLIKLLEINIDFVAVRSPSCYAHAGNDTAGWFFYCYYLLFFYLRNSPSKCCIFRLLGMLGESMLVDSPPLLMNKYYASFY